MVEKYAKGLLTTVSPDDATKRAPRDMRDTVSLHHTAPPALVDGTFAASAGQVATRPPPTRRRALPVVLLGVAGVGVAVAVLLATSGGGRGARGDTAQRAVDAASAPAVPAAAAAPAASPLVDAGTAAPMVPIADAAPPVDAALPVDAAIAAAAAATRHTPAASVVQATRRNRLGDLSHRQPRPRRRSE